MILFSARTDFFVSTIAFLDKPLWGHGSWAVDHKEKYHLLQLKMLGDKYKKNSELKLVPCHSVVMGKGVSNGIFAFVVFLWIFIKIYGLGLKGLSKNHHTTPIFYGLSYLHSSSFCSDRQLY